MKLQTHMLNLLFPPKCVLCGEIINAHREELCSDCKGSLPWSGAGLIRGDFHEGTICTLRYEENVRDAFLRFKFHGQFWLADVFGELMSETVKIELGGRFDIITWSPVSKRRRRERTFDQSELLAKSIGRALGTPVMPGLRKIKHTEPNSSLTDKDERRTNVAGAYEALTGLENRRFLLIDDVYTTGSTLSECAKTLMYGGAESVVCAAFAHAGD